MSANIHPYCRLIFFLIGITGVIVSSSPLLLLLFWLFFLLPLMAITQNLKIHLRFLLVVVLPMTVMLLFLNWILFSLSNEKVTPVLMTILKLICYTTIFQVVLLIPSDQVFSTFKKWGMRGGTLVTALGSYIVWVDIINRSDKIITARFARGFIAERTFLAKLKQLPKLLIPLIVGIMRTATERAESWEQKKMLHRIEVLQTKQKPYGFLMNFSILVISVFWFVLTIYLRWN
ncbi:MAG: hypothetical protein WCO44_03460 [Bacteroidota bacterium]